jgi:hypothetical protein
MFNEYPKCLFKDGKSDEDYVVVVDADQEAESRKLGYRMLNEPQEKSSKKVK